jgi:hypothetical protein
MIIHKSRIIWALLGSLVFTMEGYPCSIAGEISNVWLVNAADSIIRATAVEYAAPPREPRIWSTRVPDSRIRFNVIEMIRGPVVSQFTLPGYLEDTDDFNDQRPPYTFGRQGNPGGTCSAHSYRSGGQFLLFLKKTGAGELTVNWYAMAPVNEQLHSDNDPWLLWVREQAQRAVKNVPQPAPRPALRR